VFILNRASENHAPRPGEGAIDSKVPQLAALDKQWIYMLAPKMKLNIAL
jgi:hypothetical protein